MSFELVNTAATLATLVVVAATAIAALVQLRHLRGSNQIAAFNQLRDAFDSGNMTAAHLYVATQLTRDLEDPAFRYSIGDRSTRTVEAHASIKHLLVFGQFFDNTGLLVKNGLVSSDLVLDMWSEVVVWSWKHVMPATAIFRRTQDPLCWNNFEYLAVLAEEWLARHPHGTYPPNVRRFPIDDPWLQADAEYAKERAARSRTPAP